MPSTSGRSLSRTRLWRRAEEITGPVQRDRYKWAENAMEGIVPPDIAREKQATRACQLASLEPNSSPSKPTRYVEVRRRLLREHPGTLDGWPPPAE